MPTNEIQLSTGNSSGAVLRTFSATENSSVVHYQPAWVVFGANSTSPTVVTGSAGLPVAQQGTWVLGANSGVDIGDVTINNSSAAPVPIDIHVNGRQVEGSTGGHTSTAFGLVTRQVGNSSVVVTNTVTVQGNTTALLSSAVPLSSGGIGGSSGNPIFAAIQMDTRPIEASTGNHTSTAFGLITRQVGNSSVVVTNTVTITGDSTTMNVSSLAGVVHAILDSGESTVTIKGNSTAALSTLGMGGTADNPVYDVPGRYPDSTRVTLKLSSTTPSTLISSGASTRINVVDLTVTNTDAQTLFQLFSGSTAATSLLYHVILSTGGGGLHGPLTVPIRTVVAQALVAQIDPASTGVYISAGGYRST